MNVMDVKWGALSAFTISSIIQLRSARSASWNEQGTKGGQNYGDVGENVQ